MRPLKSFGSDRRGAAALEFALIAPVLLALYLGTVELCQALLAEQKAGHVASAVGDLVSRTDVVTTSDLTDILSIGAQIMQPFPGAGLGIRITSLTKGPTGAPTVDWSRGYGSLAARGPGSAVSVPMTMANGESVVMAESTYQYESVVHYVLPQAVTFNEVNYFWPRRSGKVSCTGC